ncbi:hypothetical protein EZS27_018835 [termite gut metagenome]|uniref:Uncharacterized protein n=1 Tax=termite gut metagenome TaxID=433724 RepID=A0A5J4RGC2_9ZZZZ
MRTSYLLFVTVFLLIQFLSCSENCEPSENFALYFKTVISQETTLRSSSLKEMKNDTILSLICTGKDIDWFNATTGELKFKDYVDKSIIVGGLCVYVNEEFLFSVGYVPDVMSYVLNYPVLKHSVNDNRYYIKNGYPGWDEGNPNYLSVKEDREKNWKEIEQGWNIFIEQLKKEGRYRK